MAETSKNRASRIDPAEAAKTPPAGSHAKEKLIDREKTPGTGSLPDERQPDADVGPD